MVSTVSVTVGFSPIKNDKQFSELTRKHMLILHQCSLLSMDDTTVYLFSYGQCHALVHILQND